MSFIIFISYRFYFEPIALCDDSNYSLFQLKIEITSETGNYRASDVKCEQYKDMQQQYLKYQQESGYQNPEAEKIMDTKLKDYEADKLKCLAKVRKLEKIIREFEPSFQSPIKFNYYPRVGRG